MSSDKGFGALSTPTGTNWQRLKLVSKPYSYKTTNPKHPTLARLISKGRGNPASIYIAVRPTRATHCLSTPPDVCGALRVSTHPPHPRLQRRVEWAKPGRFTSPVSCFLFLLVRCLRTGPLVAHSDAAVETGAPEG